MKQRAAERKVDNVCHGEYGWPVAGLLAEPFKIVQAPKETMILYEVDGLHRQVFTDGRKFPATFEFPAYLGYSTGSWEGDTFVVESRGFNDRTPLDAFGHPRSEAMHVTERFQRRDVGHLDTEMTFDDPRCTAGSSASRSATNWCRITISSRCSVRRTRRIAPTW